ncbi:MAG: hypothetical protein AAGF84_12115 [Planctomycetota bacterium]
MNWDFFHRVNRRGLDDASFELQSPPPTSWTQWGWGALVPVFIVGYAIVGWTADALWVPGRYYGTYFGIWLSGIDLRFAAGIMLSTALILHAWAFWGQRYCVDHLAVKLPMTLGLISGIGFGVAWAWQWVSSG